MKDADKEGHSGAISGEKVDTAYILL